MLLRVLSRTAVTCQRFLGNLIRVTHLPKDGFPDDSACLEVDWRSKPVAGNMVRSGGRELILEDITIGAPDMPPQRTVGMARDTTEVSWGGGDFARGRFAAILIYHRTVLCESGQIMVVSRPQQLPLRRTCSIGRGVLHKAERRDRKGESI